MSSALSQAEAHVEQLRVQADLERMRVSDASKDLLDYVSTNEQDDCLINPTEYNPFKERKNCLLL